MKEVLVDLIEGYNCLTQEDYNNALKEIIQDIALLGLWRAKFFEKAAFYGGTALRILYNLNRFSEDLDFILLEPNPQINLEGYFEALKKELLSFGLNVEISEKRKSKDSEIRSAFLKANTRDHVIKIDAPQSIIDFFEIEQVTKIKMEIDVYSCGGFATETRGLFSPIPFLVKVLDLPSLFSGKLHAVLCREWGVRVKGRDWFDLLWFVQKKVKVNYPFLEQKMRQTSHYLEEKPLDNNLLQYLLLKKIDSLDISRAKEDVSRFIGDGSLVDSWSLDLFRSCAFKITS